MTTHTECKMEITDNDDNNNGNNEILFWKVIHNKFLFRKIFHLIEMVEWGNCKRIPDTLLLNRVKFKNLFSMGWMVHYGQFQLLKMKLLNENEYVDIEPQNINKLLSLKIGDNKNNNNENNERISTSTLMSIPPTQIIDIYLFKEILQLILKRTNEKISDWILIALQNSNLQVINILFECINDGTTFESFIGDAFNQEDKKQFKLYFTVISHNLMNKIEINDAIFDIVEFQQRNVGNGNSYDKFKTISNGKFSGTHLTKLLDLGLFDETLNISGIDDISHCLIALLMSGENINGSDGGDYEMCSLLPCLRMLYQKEQQDQLSEMDVQVQLDKSLTTKELFKKYIILSKSTQLFQMYLSKYNQVIEELIEIKSFKYISFMNCINCFNLDLLNHFKQHLNSEFTFQMFAGEYKRKVKPFVSNNLSKSIEFLKMYLSTISTITNGHLDSHESFKELTINIIFDIVFEINDKIQYEQIVNEVIPECYQSYIPLKWNPIINQLNNSSTLGNKIIEEIETINWMKDWFIKLKKTFILIPWFFRVIEYRYILGLLNFENVKLSEYAFNQLQFLKLEKCYYYKIPFFKAILEFDYQTIKYIHSLGITFTVCSMEFDELNELLISNNAIFYGVNDGSNIINYQLINEIINFIIKNRMIGHQICHLIQLISKNDDGIGKNNNGNGLVKFDLGQFKFNLNGLKEDYQINLAKEFEIIKVDYNYKFLLSNIKFTSAELELSILDFNFQCDSPTNQGKFNLLIPLIHLFIDQLNQCREILIDSTALSPNQLPNLQIYYSFLNQFFSLLLKFTENQLMFKQIEQICQLFIDNMIPLELDYESKLISIKYRFPILYEYISVSNVQINDTGVLPFQIFQSTFDQMVEYIYRPSSIIGIDFNNPKDIKKLNIYYNLIFSLFINRFDLFLKEWQLKIQHDIFFSDSDDFILYLICVTLEENSIIDLINGLKNDSKSNTDGKKNKVQLLLFLRMSLKLGIFNISKLVSKFLLKYSNNDNNNNNQISDNDDGDNIITLISNSNDNYILNNRYKLIEMVNNHFKEL